MNWKQVNKHNEHATFEFKQANNASKTGKNPELLPSTFFLCFPLYVLNPSPGGGGNYASA